MRAPNHFEAAMRGQPAPPCIGCRYAVKCAKQQLACAEFSGYVSSHMSVYAGSARTPSRARYLKAFPSIDQDEL
jgi:hypothetical protein